MKTESTDQGSGTPIVAIGASAGGFEALREFLQAMPSDSGACFVYVQHLDPSHQSMLAELLAGFTDMRVLQASDNLDPQPDTVVLIPPDATLTYAGGILHIVKPAPPRRHRTPIDSFFESLASEAGDNAVCVLLSGTGSDGTHGLALVKEAGGLTIVQDPRSARYDSMPRNAIATGFVDHELAPRDIPGVLVDHFQKTRKFQADGGLEGLRELLTSDLVKICGILRARTGHEFRDYKEATLLRRIHRRMQVLRIEHPADYVARLGEDPGEVGRLLRELLISVTGFFRDAPAFDTLVETVIDPMLTATDGTVRIWSPGCATGEEAYTLAMLVNDRAEAMDKRVKLQLFATDIDERALEVARRACYPEAALERVPERFRSRYFRQEGPDFRIVDELREVCLFSAQNLIKDPPFSRLDLISCRNVLIYMKPDLQHRLMPIFHYALRDGGALLLGPSENVTKHARLFETVDGKWRIFRRKQTGDGPPGLSVMRTHYGMHDDGERLESPRPRGRPKPTSLVDAAERLVLDRLGPAYAVVAQDRELLYTGGGIERYLSVPRGSATQDVVAMATPDLRMDVRTILHRVVSDGAETVHSQVMVKRDGRHRRVRLECAPLGPDAGRQTFVLAFHDCGEIDLRDAGDAAGDGGSSLEALERELTATKQYLQSTTEELESSNEELKSANEELMSMNEELQSSNEELETSKEELQSVNEELETVNSELAAKVDQLGLSNADLQNLLESTQIATLFLDRTLRIRRFTPKAKELFHLIDSDVGRSITDIAPRIDEPDIEHLVAEVLATRQPAQRKVGLRGRDLTFMMRVLPYRTSAGAIEGIVATFVDITELTAAEESAERRAAQQEFVASISGAVLGGESVDSIVGRVPADVARLLNAEFAKFLRQVPETGEFELMSRFGFREPVGTRIPGGMNSQAGYTAHAKVPIIVEDLEAETRFSGPRLLRANGVRSGISTTIPLPEGGLCVLGVHSREVRLFEPDDIAFVQAVANAISTGFHREAFLAALKDGEERLASALVAGKLGVHDYDPVTQRVRWDAAIRSLWGVADDLPIDFDVFLNGVHPDDRDSVLAELAEALDPDGPGRFDAVYRVVNARTQEVRWVSADGNVTFADGKAVRLVGTAMDITDRRRAEQHVQMLMGEVNHRAKNLLAVVQSIASRTARTSPPAEFASTLSRRLQGLAAAQDLIIKGDWRAVAMADLATSQLEPLGDDILGRVVLDGEELHLTPSAAQGVGLAFHELATNALKYGALSSDGGRVTVSWSGSPAGEVRIVWTESGGPPVTVPEKRGFGSTVIERMAANAVQGQVDLDFRPDGLTWRLTASADKVLYDPLAMPSALGVPSSASFGVED